MKFIIIKNIIFEYLYNECELNGNIYDYIFLERELFKYLSWKDSIFNLFYRMNLYVCNLKRCNYIIIFRVD